MVGCGTTRFELLDLRGYILAGRQRIVARWSLPEAVEGLQHLTSSRLATDLAVGAVVYLGSASPVLFPAFLPLVVGPGFQKSVELLSP
jgi:hypothetical protein